VQIDLEDVQSVNKHVTMYYLPSFAFLCVYSKVLVETGKAEEMRVRQVLLATLPVL